VFDPFNGVLKMTEFFNGITGEQAALYATYVVASFVLYGGLKLGARGGLALCRTVRGFFTSKPEAPVSDLCRLVLDSLAKAGEWERKSDTVAARPAGTPRGNDKPYQEVGYLPDTETVYVVVDGGNVLGTDVLTPHEELLVAAAVEELLKAVNARHALQGLERLAAPALKGAAVSRSNIFGRAYGAEGQAQAQTQATIAEKVVAAFGDKDVPADLPVTRPLVTDAGTLLGKREADGTWVLFGRAGRYAGGATLGVLATIEKVADHVASLNLVEGDEVTAIMAGGGNLQTSRPEVRVTFPQG
jgi:hypothetical protein